MISILPTTKRDWGTAHEANSLHHVPHQTQNLSWETLATSILEKAGLRTYCPMAATDTTIQGKKVIVERPLIPNTVFVYAPFRQLNSLKNANPFITYCYKKVDGKFKILQVPTREMELFIDSSTKMKADITYFHPDEVELKKGDRVKM